MGDGLWAVRSLVPVRGESIPTNLAEGIGKRGDEEKARFANIAIGSAYELEYQLLLARDLGYLSTADHTALNSALFTVRKMLHAFHRRLRAKPPQPTAHSP
jgi:four helix bundle protein